MDKILVVQAAATATDVLERMLSSCAAEVRRARQWDEAERALHSVGGSGFSSVLIDGGAGLDEDGLARFVERARIASPGAVFVVFDPRSLHAAEAVLRSCGRRNEDPLGEPSAIQESPGFRDAIHRRSAMRPRI